MLHHTLRACIGPHGRGSQEDVRLTVPRKVHPTKAAHAAIRVNEMPAVRVYATGRDAGPILGMGCRSHKICDGRGVYWLERM